MFDPISSARGKLGDPLILNWALSYYENLPGNAQTLRTKIETEWFHDVFIARLIDQGETEILLTLFHLLPEQRLAAHTHQIIQHWSMWPTELAGASTPVLTKHAPQVLLQLIDTQLQHIERGNLDAMMRFLDLRWLDTIEQKQSFTPVFDRISEFLLALPEDDLDRSFFLSSLLRASGVLSTEQLAAALNAVLNNRELSNDDDEQFFNSLFYGLFGQIEYLGLVFARARNESQQSVTALAPFFVADAPLAQFDEWLASPPAFAQIEPVLEQAAQCSDGCSKLVQLFQSLSKRDNALSNANKSKLSIAACLHGYARDSFDDLMSGFEATVTLLSADLLQPRAYSTVLAHMRTFERQVITAALINCLPQIRSTYGSVQLARAMGDLAWPEFVPVLIDSLARDQHDFLCEAAQQALMNIGAEAQHALVSRWEELDSSQQIYGSSVIQFVGGEAVADFVYVHFDALMDDDLERCCELIKTTPDQRLFERLQPELKRKQVYIDEAYYIVARLLDQEDETVQAAKERVLAEKEKREKRRAAMDTGDFSREYLTLALRCQSCGDVNQYQVSSVIVPKQQTKKEYCLVNDEFPCASCEQYADFEFTTDAVMALSGEMMIASMAKERDQYNHSLIRFVDCRLDGETMPFAVALKQLRHRAALSPDDAFAWLQLGKLLTHINRPRAAIQALSQAIQITPDAVDVTLILAHQYMTINEHETAFQQLSDAMVRLSDWRFLSRQPSFAQEFANTYNLLRRQLNRDDLPLLHPSSLTPPKKIGRNDPCPCGSGKKYKKCCGH